MGLQDLLMVPVALVGLIFFIGYVIIGIPMLKWCELNGKFLGFVYQKYGYGTMTEKTLLSFFLIVIVCLTMGFFWKYGGRIIKFLDRPFTLIYFLCADIALLFFIPLAFTVIDLIDYFIF